MSTTTGHPVAVRATGFIGESRWRRRPVGRVRYDACWADGRVEFDVSLTAAMYRGWPADFGPINDSVHANCPEVGTGRWVNVFAAVVDGPEVENPNPPGPRSGWPSRSGVARREPSPRVRLAWRLSLGWSRSASVSCCSPGQPALEFSPASVRSAPSGDW